MVTQGRGTTDSVVTDMTLEEADRVVKALKHFVFRLDAMGDREEADRYLELARYVEEKAARKHRRKIREDHLHSSDNSPPDPGRPGVR